MHVVISFVLYLKYNIIYYEGHAFYVVLYS